MVQSIGATTFTLNRMVDHAVRRCKMPAQKITAETQSIARECMQLLLLNVHNRKMPLWCQEKLLLPIYENEAEVTMPDGTVDVLKAFYRQTLRVGDSYNSAEGVAANLGDGDLATSCTQVSINGFMSVQFLNATPVTLVGFMPNGDHFYNVVFEASNDAVTWTLLQSVDPSFGEVATFYPDKKWAWYDIKSPATSLMFRIRETSGGVLDLRELVVSSRPQDILMFRMNKDQYFLQPNKTVPGRPLQFWLNRQMDNPVITLWPPPSNAEILNCLYVWRHRYIADVQDLNQEIEIPRRWYEGITWKLADSLSNEIEGVDPEVKAVILEKVAETWGPLLAEERDRSPIQIRYNLRRYTRS